MRARDAMAWRNAFTVLDDLKPLFTLAASRTPELVARYPSLAALFAASTGRAQRSVETRRKNAKDAAARAKAAADAPADPAAVRALLPAPAPAASPRQMVNVTLK